MYNRGTGTVRPEDTEEYIEVTLTVADGEITDAVWRAYNDACAEDCARTVCRVIKGHTPADVMQMTNNAVFYNTENKIPRQKLYLGAMAVMAAKKAAADWAEKNGIKDFPHLCCCS